MLYHHGLLFVLKAIRIKLINRHQDNFLAGHFSIKKICKLLMQKYFWSTFRHDVEAYVKSGDVCLISKAVRHKRYSNL